MAHKTSLFSSIALLCCSPLMAQFGSTVQYFPQFAIDGGARTFFTIHNPGENPLTVDLTLTRSDGSSFLSEQVSLAAGATEIVAYGEPGGKATAGWAKLTSTGEFSATLFYAIAGVGNVGVLPSPEAKAMKVFTYVGEGTDTGFAVANPSATLTSTLTFQIYNAEGQLQREETLQLGPNEHRAFLFSESPYLVTANGSVTVLATEPVVALALRLDESLLSGVGVVVPGLPIRGEWNDTSPNIIGGHKANRVDEGAVGATIAGGGFQEPGWCDTCENRVAKDWGTVSGGRGNTALEGGSTIGGGARNNASGVSSTISGGAHSEASGRGSTVGGGEYNGATGKGTTVGGGSSNHAAAIWATVAGGNVNTASGNTSTVGGGFANTASGIGSTVCGGFWNEARGQHSFAAGRNAKALHDGTFVWADDRPGDFGSTNSHQFLMRAEGGVGINTNSPQGALDVNGSIYQRGSSLHADYVFEPDYKLESIGEHSRFMWSKKHLPALPAGEKDEQGRDVVEYGSRMRGMLEELEKAHVYIEQLDARLQTQQEELEKLKSALADYTGDHP